MAGIGLLFIYAALVFLAVFALRLAFKILPRLLALVVAAFIVSLPFVDASLGRRYLEAECEQLGRVQVKKTVDGVEGIYNFYGPYADSPKYYGYKIVEGGAYNIRGIEDIPKYSGLVDRATEGVKVVEKHVPSKTLYEIVDEPRKDSFYFYSVRTVVRERATLEEMAAFTWFYFRGGWLERIPMALSDAGGGIAASCGNTQEKHRREVEALHLTLKPL
jgi:hypothetical protein